LDSPSSQELLEFLDEDLSTLLQAKYGVFWSTIIFNDTVLPAFESVIHHFPRLYDLKFNGLSSIAQSVFKKTLQLAVRISMNRESENSFMDVDFHVNILNERKLFRLSSLFDICALFGTSNVAIVSELLKRVFIAIPDLYEQLHAASAALAKSLDSIAATVVTSKLFESDVSGSLSHEQHDMLQFVNDAAWTVLALVRAYPPAAHAFSLVAFMSPLVRVYQMWLAHAQEKDGVAGLARRAVLHLVNVVIEHGFIQLMLRESSCELCSKLVLDEVAEQMYATLDALAHQHTESESNTAWQTEPQLLIDLALHCNLIGGLQRLRRAGNDDARLEFMILLLEQKQADLRPQSAKTMQDKQHITSKAKSKGFPERDIESKVFYHIMCCVC